MQTDSLVCSSLLCCNYKLHVCKAASPVVAAISIDTPDDGTVYAAQKGPTRANCDFTTCPPAWHSLLAGSTNPKLSNKHCRTTHRSLLARCHPSKLTLSTTHSRLRCIQTAPHNKSTRAGSEGSRNDDRGRHQKWVLFCCC